MPFAEVSGTRLFYQYQKGESKVPKKYVVLLIHGLGSSHCFFQPALPPLTSAGYACLSFDLPGAALPSSESQKNGIEILSRFAEALLSYLTIPSQNVVLVGHSMGSLIAGDLAKRLLVAGIVLIGPIFPSTELSSVFDKRIKLVRSEGIERIAIDVPRAATGSLATSLHRAFIGALLLSQDLESYVTLCKCIADAPKIDYVGIKGPVLMIAGEDDKTASIQGVQQVLDCYSDVVDKQLVRLPGVGHWHCIEAPEEVADLLVSFLSKFA